MYEIKRRKQIVGGMEVTTYQREVAYANILEVEAGTSGYCGGDSGHGSRTYIRIQDEGGTDIDITSIHGDYDIKGVEITLGGDSELKSIIEALKFVVTVLEDQAQNE